MADPNSTSPEKGATFETVCWRNEGEQRDKFPFRATTINGVKSTKVILCADHAVPLGQPVRVKVTRVTRPQSPGRGFIEAAYLGLVTFPIDPDIYIDRQIAKKLQVLLEAGYSILLDGPQGSGKTVLSRSIATGLDMEYVYFNCASAYEATDFIATIQIRANEQGVAETVFIPTEICLALKEAAEKPYRRYLIFLDEFNRCRPMARNGLMPALDSTRKVYDPAENRMLPIPENVQFCAAINNGDQFVGATAVDPAQMDRFATLKLGYPPPEEEAKLLARRFPSLAQGILRSVVYAAHKVRTSEELMVDLSMRATQEACTLLSHPYYSEGTDEGGDRESTLKEVLATAFCGRFPGRIDDPASDAASVWGVILNALHEGDGSR